MLSGITNRLEKTDKDNKQTKQEKIKNKYQRETFYNGKLKAFNQRTFTDIYNKYNSLFNIKKLPLINKQGSCFGLLALWYQAYIEDTKAHPIDKLLALQEKLERKIKASNLWSWTTSLFSMSSIATLYHDRNMEPSAEELSCIERIIKLQKQQKEYKTTNYKTVGTTLCKASGSFLTFFKLVKNIPDDFSHSTIIPQTIHQICISIIMLRNIREIILSMQKHPKSLFEIILVFSSGKAHICGAIADIKSAHTDILFFDANLGEIKFSNIFHFSNFLQEFIPAEYPEVVDIQFTVSTSPKLKCMPKNM